MSSTSITTPAQLDELIVQVEDAVLQARRAGLSDADRLKRRHDTLIEVRRGYRKRNNELAYQEVALQNDLNHAEHRLQQAQEQARIGVERAQLDRDTLAQRLADTQAAQAALSVVIPPEEAYAPPDQVVTILGLPHYFRHNVAVNADGSPLTNKRVP